MRNLEGKTPLDDPEDQVNSSTPSCNTQWSSSSSLTKSFPRPISRTRSEIERLMLHRRHRKKYCRPRRGGRRRHMKKMHGFQHHFHEDRYLRNHRPRRTNRVPAFPPVVSDSTWSPGSDSAVRLEGERLLSIYNDTEAAMVNRQIGLPGPVIPARVKNPGLEKNANNHLLKKQISKSDIDKLEGMFKESAKRGKSFNQWILISACCLLIILTIMLTLLITLTGVINLGAGEDAIGKPAEETIEPTPFIGEDGGFPSIQPTTYDQFLVLIALDKCANKQSQGRVGYCIDFNHFAQCNADGSVRWAKRECLLHSEALCACAPFLIVTDGNPCSTGINSCVPDDPLNPLSDLSAEDLENITSTSFY